jgi:hypothetical protein
VRRAIERWLEEGWSLWRIVSGAGSAVIALAAVVAYVTHPHRFTAWLTIFVAAVAFWAVLEMIRWRILFRRLQRQTAASAEAPSEPWGTPLFDVIPGGRGYSMALQPTPTAKIVSGMKCEVTSPQGGLPAACVMQGPISPDSSSFRMCSYPQDFGLPVDQAFEDGEYVIRWFVADDQGAWTKVSEASRPLRPRSGGAGPTEQ